MRAGPEGKRVGQGYCKAGCGIDADAGGGVGVQQAQGASFISSQQQRICAALHVVGHGRSKG